MICDIPIKERIERVVRLAIAGIEGIGTVYRWDMRGVVHPVTGKMRDEDGARLFVQAGDGVLYADDETAEEAGTGGGDLTLKRLPLEVHVKILVPESYELPGGTAALGNWWLMVLQRAVTRDPRLTEPAGVGKQEALAIDVTVMAVTSVEGIEAGQRELDVGIRFEVQYEHLRNDPAVGPGITLYQEEIVF